MSNFQNKIFSVVPVYAPNIETERIQYFNMLEDWIKNSALGINNLIIGDDFNCTLNCCRNTVKSHVNDKSRKIMQKLVNNLHCVDTWNVLNDETTYTYYDKSTNQYSRLDYIFMSKDFSNKLMKTYVSQPVRDIHVIDFSVVCNFQMNTTNACGPGCWKFNNQHLQNADLLRAL